MKLPYIAAGFLALCLLGTPLSQFDIQAAEPSPGLKAALDELESWLDGQTYEDAWRKKLRLGELEAQVDPDAPVDWAVLTEVLNEFSGPSEGLRMRKFSAVRLRLDEWMDELAHVPLNKLPQLARDSKGDFLPVTSEQAAAAKASLQKAYDRLDRVLSGTGEVQKSWREYFGWEDLKEELGSDEPPHFDFLTDVKRQFDNPDEQLNRSEFAGVGYALRRYLIKAKAASNEDFQEHYEQAVDELAAALGQYIKKPSTASLATIQSTLAQIESDGRESRLSRAVRQHFARPNLYARIGEDLFNASISRDTNETTAIRDTFRGTRIRGNARTIGKLWVEFAPNDEVAAIEARFKGTANSNTVGRNGPATIRSAGVTRLVARKRIELDADGFHPLPAETKASTNTETTGLSLAVSSFAQSRARATARQRIAQSRPQANAHSARRAERQLSERLDKEIDEAVGPTSSGFTNFISETLTRRGQFPGMQFSTTEEQLHASVRHAPRGVLGAATKPPADDDTAELSIRVHESMLSNVATTMLAGVTMTNNKWEKWSERLELDMAQRLEGDWLIMFPDQKAISTKISAKGLRITVHALAFSRQGRSHNTPMDVSALYALQATDSGGLVAQRRGEIEINPPDLNDRANKRLSARETASKPVLARAFEKIFEEKFQRDYLELPGSLNRAGNMLWTKVVTRDDGWAMMSWRREAPPEVAEAAE